MSIKDSTNDEEIIRIGTINSWAFKITIWCAPIFSAWMVKTVLTHDKSIGLHELRLSMLEHRSSGNTTQNVNVGAVEGMASREMDEAARARGHYLVADVATILRKSERAVTEMCASGKLPGAWRDKDSGSSPWKIPLSLLLGAADPPSGKQPQTAAVSGKHTPPEEEP